MIVINLLAGPSAGKSTIAAGLFYLMKKAGLSVGLATEYAKELIYDGRRDILLTDALHVFEEQKRRIDRFTGHVQYVVTDAPLLHVAIYEKNLKPAERSAVLQVHRSYQRINLFIERAYPYETSGRSCTEEDAKRIDVKIEELLLDIEDDYHVVHGGEYAPERALHLVREGWTCCL